MDGGRIVEGGGRVVGGWWVGGRRVVAGWWAGAGRVVGGWWDDGARVVGWWLEGGGREVRRLRHRTPLSSRVVHRVSGHLSSFIWNLCLFPEDATGVSVPFHVLTSSSGLHLKRCPGIGTYLEWMGKSVSFGMLHDPRGFLSSFNVRPASS